MTKSYESMIYLAALKLQTFFRYNEIIKEHPDNTVARECAEHEAINASAYCDAIADMFDRTYEAVYEDAHNAVADL